jgi:uncharacterized protein YjiS (DUF1127 family)
MSTSAFEIRVAGGFATRPGLFTLLGCWRQRARQRRHLAALDARALSDVGLSRERALREARKPFWVE